MSTQGRIHTRQFQSLHFGSQVTMEGSHFSLFLNGSQNSPFFYWSLLTLERHRFNRLPETYLSPLSIHLSNKPLMHPATPSLSRRQPTGNLCLSASSLFSPVTCDSLTTTSSCFRPSACRRKTNSPCTPNQSTLLAARPGTAGYTPYCTLVPPHTAPAAPRPCDGRSRSR